MKSRTFLLVAALSLLLSVGLANAATTLMEIGRSPFCQVPLTSSDDLIVMIRNKKADVKKGFGLTPQAYLYEAFMEQVPQARIDTVQVPKGSNFQWMFFRKKSTGAVQLVKDVTWGNEKPFPGFQFHIDHEGRRYVFVVPFGCGNIALMDVIASPAVAEQPLPVMNQAPECSMTVSPIKALCGEMITVDARSSVDKDGGISKMTIAFIDDQGRVVSEKVVEGDGLVGQVAMPHGQNTLKVTITDDQGEESTSSACATDVTGTSRLHFLVDFGYLHQIDPANYMLGRVGLKYKFTEQYSVLGLVGVAPHFEGLDGESAYLVDLLGEYDFSSKSFVNFGVGGWITDGDDDLDTEDSQLDLIIGMGTRIYGEPDEFNTSLFFEIRSAPDELNDIIDYGRFGGGLRCSF